MGCLEAILMLIAIGWVIVVLSFVWTWSPFLAITIVIVSAVILYYFHSWITNKTEGNMTQRTCQKCGELNQSRLENQDWTCFKCGSHILKEVECPDCGRITGGTLTDAGTKAALCPDCYNTFLN